MSKFCQIKIREKVCDRLFDLVVLTSDKGGILEGQYSTVLEVDRYRRLI
ncbi:MAG: hypothetical protein ACHBN1_31175 [Heteroscytonema crispum UTEX LB 1556]